jgi:UDP-glucose 4-epimerase
LVTGCGGFIGSHLAERLLAEGWDVLGLDCFNDNYGRAQKLDNLSLAREWDAFEFVPVDLAGGYLEDLVDGCDVVFHLAAEPGVRPSWGPRFAAYVRNNVVATQHLLDAIAATAEPPRLVYASSSSVYGSTSGPAAETAMPEPFSPYGITKLTAEHLVQAYHLNLGLATVSLRYFSVYGPRQRPDMAFHIFCRAALRSEPVNVFGDGHQTRDFTFVDDVVAATIEAAVRDGLSGSIFNIGAGHQVSVRDAIELIERLAECGIDVSYAEAEPGDVRHTEADATQAHKRLGWRPRKTFGDGLRAELEWLIAREPAAPMIGP